jgi:hypothetical protein
MRGETERAALGSRLLQRGQVVVDRGEQNARGPFGFCGINTDLSHTPKLRVS